MMKQQYILSVDQSTQGTKALLFDQTGKLLCRQDLPHEQLVGENGWVSHDLNEIYWNTIQAVKAVVKKAGIDKNQIAGLGISNQRETSAAWDRVTKEPVGKAIVWQCCRAKKICEKVEQSGYSDLIQRTTGIPLSPYFPASKFAWILQNEAGAKEKQKAGTLLFGTIDTWLIFKLTAGKSFKTDYSNASRTQLFNINTLCWEEKICSLFGYHAADMAQVCDSDAVYGETDFEGFLDNPIPICGVLGDSHGALFGQGCLEKGMIKTTYGTGSSIMMNIGARPLYSKSGVVTSLAWGRGGRVSYVLEGNINYTGAVISWLKDEMQIISTPEETEALAIAANPEDETYLVPAFTGLGAPYWNSDAKAIICGMSRTTKRAEIVKAGIESIAYQITDIVQVMKQDSGIKITELRVDGGPTKNGYLMQFQSDMTGIPVLVPDAEELSGIGVAYLAGISLGIYGETLFAQAERRQFNPEMNPEQRQRKYKGWKSAINKVL